MDEVLLTPEFDTIPKVLKYQCQKYRDKKVAMRQKDFGIWREYTWEDLYQTVKHLSLGLISLGLEPGQKVCIVGENKIEWIFAMYGVLCARAIVTTGIYADALSAEYNYVLDHSEASFIVVEDQEQVDRMLEVADKIPQVKKIIYWDPKGLRHYKHSLLLNFSELVQLGKDYDREHPWLFEQNVDTGKGSEIGLLSYTSGTTKEPKGALLEQEKFLNWAVNFVMLDPSSEDDEFLSITPLAWPLDTWSLILRALLTGGVINFPEEEATIEENLREIGFSMAFLPPRTLDALARMIQVKIADADFLKRLIYNLFVPLGYRMVDFKLAGMRPGPVWRAIYYIGYLLLFRPLLDKIGLLKAKLILSGGAALSPDTFRYFLALGAKVKQVYGSTEAGPYFFHRSDDVKLDTAGVVSPNAELRISTEGEILLKTPGMMQVYYKDTEATGKFFDDTGWAHTGDAGYITEGGHLVVIDRVVDLMRLTDGTGFSPMFIENKLKFIPYIKDAIIVGDDAPFVSAIVCIDYAYVGKWAEDNAMAYTTYTDLSQKPEVYNIIEHAIRQVNKTLPAATTIKRFALLYKELDSDDAELTRTKKLRRGFLSERYKDLINALYSDDSQYTVEISVRYKDGRALTMKTSVKIASLEAKG